MSFRDERGASTVARTSGAGRNRPSRDSSSPTPLGMPRACLGLPGLVQDGLHLFGHLLGAFGRRDLVQHDLGDPLDHNGVDLGGPQVVGHVLTPAERDPWLATANNIFKLAKGPNRAYNLRTAEVGTVMIQRVAEIMLNKVTPAEGAEKMTKEMQAILDQPR